MADRRDQLMQELYRRQQLQDELRRRGVDPQIETSVARAAGKIPPNQPMGYGESFATGMQDPIVGGRQLYTHITGSEQEAEKVDQAVREREAGLKKRGYSGVARGVGSAATTFPLMATGAGGIPGAVAGGAAMGALQPTTDKNFVAGKAIETAAGGAIGGAGTVAGRAIGAAIAPTMQEGAQELTQQGVRLTPGQASGGFFRRLEEAAKSLPILGHLIRGGEQKSMEDFNLSVLNQALEPIGQSLGATAKAGHSAVAETSKRLGAAYDKLLPTLKLVDDGTLSNDVMQVRFAAQELPEAQKNQFETIIRQRLAPLLNRSPVGPRQGQTLKDVDGGLRTFADNYRSSPDPAQRDLAERIDDVRDALRSALTRQNPKDKIDALNRIDTGWAMYTRARGAAANRATSTGVFTPGDLLASVKRQDKSAGKGAFARGDALMQLYAEAGQKVLPQKMPDSGTPERLRAFDLVSGAAAAPFTPLYSSPGMAAARKMMQPGTVRRSIRKSLRGSAPYLSIGGTPALMDSLPGSEK